MNKLTTTTFAVTFAAFAILLLLLPTPPVTLGDAAADSAVIIDSVRVFDGEELRGPTTLVLANGRVAAIGDDAKRPAGARVIDGRGKTALPGLIDAHTHSYGTGLSDALRFGVTTHLDMFTDPATIGDMGRDRESVAKSDSAALFSAGMLATVDGGHGTQFGVDVEGLTGPEHAAAWVAARKAEGSDYIKLAYIPNTRDLPTLDLATARAVIEAAHAEGLMAVAHISTEAAALELLDAGIDGFVHVFADVEVSDAFIDRALEAGVFVIPTLSVIARADGKRLSEALIDDEHLGPYLTAAQQGSLAGDFGGPYPGFSLDIAQHNVGRLHAAGIPILAGSDAPNPGTAYGVTLHQELALLVEAGLSATDALNAATRGPAAVFATAGRGELKAGARADLVLVAGDPSTDILATRAIAAVFRNGYELERAATADAPAGDAMPTLLGDFETGVDAPEGFVWTQTTDSMMGGSSEASLAHTGEGAGGSAGALAVTADVYLDFPYPWAGAYLALYPEGRTGDLSPFAAIEFDVRGTAASYRLMLFASDQFGAPPTATFAVDADWTHVSLPLERFAGFKAEQFTGLAISTPMEAGHFEFEIDNVTLVQ
ncbi:MAG: CIA30 family protein [Pseudomonadota bacterium]